MGGASDPADLPAVTFDEDDGCPTRLPDWEMLAVDGVPDEEHAVAAVYLGVLKHLSRVAVELERNDLYYVRFELGVLKQALASLTRRLDDAHVDPGDGEPVWREGALDARRIRDLVAWYGQSMPIARVLHPGDASGDAKRDGGTAQS